MYILYKHYTTFSHFFFFNISLSNNTVEYFFKLLQIAPKFLSAVIVQFNKSCKKEIAHASEIIL